MKIKVAQLQSAVQIPGVFVTEMTLSDDKVKGIQMEWTASGLIVEVKGRKGIIPLANIKIGIIDEEQPKKVK